jgi:hypothetical protein
VHERDAARQASFTSKEVTYVKIEIKKVEKILVTRYKK